MKTKLIDAIKRRLGLYNGLDLEYVFSEKLITKIPMKYTNNYPLTSDWMNGRAYALTFLISEECYSTFASTLNDLGYSIDESKQDNLISGKSKQISSFFSIRRAFSGVMPSIISNDCDLIVRIKEAQLQPPMPSTSFPELDPGNYGSLQGDLDFWFYHLWLPFWNSLTPEKQAKLPIDKAWRSFIESHM